ncbi:hypothetical protein AAFF_G00027780 [Aldrovandia affinis]|uniref:MAM domain-containing protein n=1 Tax=Aldrovandia affinis TaxID=143900 RepID=A0AAD7WGM4_9TELE|nr:hypothetical protein AAFF_G00027780 [Aldrovandia affinis]
MGLHSGIGALLLLYVLHWVMSLALLKCQTEQKCDFVCDCVDCSDEQDCGYSSGFVCDFEDVGACGWKTQSDGLVYTWERRQRGNPLPNSGPSSDYTIGTSTGWFMGVTSVNTDSPSTTALVSPMMKQSAVTCQLRLRYFIWDSGQTGVDRQTLWGSVERVDGQQAVVWRPDTSSVRGWREDSIYLGRIPQEFRLLLHSRRSQGHRGDVAIDQMEFLGCALPVPEKKCADGFFECGHKGCVEAQQVCDGSDDCGDGTDEENCDGYWGCGFEDGLCEWDLRTPSSLTWSRTNQNNLSVSGDPTTGPGRDHSTNTVSGFFLYLTKTETMKDDWSQFQSPVLEPTNSSHPCQMVLYTHQFGPRSGGLSVLVVDTNMHPMWERGGQLGDVWVKAVVEFVINDTFQIVLVGAIRDKEFGGIAVDSIIMSPGCRISNESSPIVEHPKPPFSPCTTSEHMCDFQPDCDQGEDEAKCGDFSYAQGITGWTDTSIGTQGWAQQDSSEGQYLYVTDVPGQQLKEAQSRTPLLGPSGPACTLHLSYSLTGNSSHIGELSISVIDSEFGMRSQLWEVSGKPEEEWLKAEVYIGARDNRFQLELGGLANCDCYRIAVKDVHYRNCHPGHLPSTGQGRSLVVDMWRPSLRGLSGRLLSFPHLPTQSEHCLSFWFKLYGPQTGSLNVKIISGGAEVLVWTRTGAHGNRWHHGLCPIPHQHIKFQVVFEAIRSGFDGQVGIDDVAVLARPCSGPLACSFEGQRCGYNSFGDSAWIHQNLISGGVRPAPKTDHTLETDQGSLNVYTKSAKGERTKLFSNNLNQGDAWRHANGNISSSEAWQDGEIVEMYLGIWDSLVQPSFGQGDDAGFLLEFEVVGAGGTQGYVAIDDIIISPHRCPLPDAECSLETGLCGWSNTQVKDLLDWELTSAELEKHYSTPPRDHTLETDRGHFLFLPSSPRDTADQEAWLLSPHLPPTLGTCLRFWVHRPVSHDGGLVVVRLSRETQEQLLRLGEVRSVWRRYDINIISKDEYQIVFQGLKGKIGPLALDDIQYTLGVNCAGENTDSKSPPPSDDKGGIAASIIVLLLLLITMTVLFVFYLRKRGWPRTQGQEPMTSTGGGGIPNEAYDPGMNNHVIVPPIDGESADGFANVSYRADSEEREIA